jgi:phospholipase C
LLELLEPRIVLAGDIHTIQHVIIIMQENRSFDDYFGTYPGAAGFPMQNGAPAVSIPDPITGGSANVYHRTTDIDVDAPHGYRDAVDDINGGAMNGFLSTYGPGDVTTVMGYHNAQEIPNYWSYAQHFVLQDHLFESVLGWSKPSHLYLVSGWSADSPDPNNPDTSINDPANPSLPPANGEPIYGWTDLTYLLHQYNVSWSYYNAPWTGVVDSDEGTTPAIWNPLPNFTDVHQDNQLGNVQDSSQFFQAAAAGTLPQVSWVMPNSLVSEHAPNSISDGQAWVTGLVNAVMQGPDWNSSAIFVTWDDWGGQYDNAVPPVVDSNGYGLRVPGLVISPWAKQGYIDHQTLSPDAYLKFIEDDFLGGQRIDPATDGRPDDRPDVRENMPQLGDLVNDFDFTQTPLPPLVLAQRPVSPNPDANGPYTIQQGQSLTLAATGSTDPLGYSLTYGWGLRGTQEYQDAIGLHPTLTCARLTALGINEPGQYFIVLRASDGHGLNGDQLTTLTVLPANPAVTLAGSTTASEGLPYTLSLAAAFVGLPDSSTVFWGDGTATTNPARTATPTHTYAEEGTYTLSATATDGGTTYQGLNTVTVQVADASLQGTLASLTPAEGNVFQGVVAFFTDADPGGTTGDYTATIAWGDGQTSPGPIAAASGGFTVAGNHTYAEEGSYPLTVTVRDAGGATTTISGMLTVSDSALRLTPPTTLVERASFQGAVATFTDTDDSSVGDFSAMVNWGNGQQTTGTIQATTPGHYAIIAAQTYAEEGSYPFTVTLTDERDGSSPLTASGTVVVADAPLQASAQNLKPTQGSAFNGVVTAFRDPGSDGTISDYSATITWGDGHTSAGTVQSDGQGGFTVSGGNTFAEEGTYTVTVLLQDQGGARASVSSEALVQDASLQGVATTFSPSAGGAFDGVVASFRDPGSEGTASDYRATIAWGDGTTSAGAVFGSGASFQVAGVKTYAAVGSYTITVTVQDEGGAAATIASAVSVTGTGLAASGQAVAAQDGIAANLLVATFTDLRGNGTPGASTVSINWGDGQTSPGSVTATSVTTFTVHGSHSYAEEGTEAVMVSIQGPGGGASVTAYSLVSVADAPLTGLARTVAATEAAAFSGTVANFTDADRAGAAQEYSATIFWGDGTTSAGAIVANSAGGFDVQGRHTYAEAASYAVVVTIHDAGGAAVVVHETASIAAADLTDAGQNLTAVEQTPFSGTVATFTDPAGTGMASAYSTIITWGDGQTSVGTITASSATAFTVEGSHLYAAAGTYRVTVRITHDNISVTANGTAHVADMPLPALSNNTAFGYLASIDIFTPMQGVLYSGPVAMFTDPGSDGALSAYSVTIHWGDGTTTPGTVSPANDPRTFMVSGTHTYAAPGAHLVTVQVVDDSGAQTTLPGAALVYAGTPTRREVALLYSTLLGRTVDPTGLTDWDSYLTQGVPVAEVAAALEATTEYRGRAVQDLYLRLLERDADPAGLATFVGMLNNGGTLEQVAVAISGSPEYFQRRGSGTNGGFLTAIYADALNRAPDSAGRAAFDQALANGTSTTQVAAILYGSPEYQHDLVHAAFQEFLSRAPTASELSVYTAELVAGATSTRVRADIAGAGQPETGNQRFVGQLYLDVLGRCVDPAALQSWTAKLGQGVSRAAVASAIATSPEARQHEVTEVYEELLQRPPDAQGLQAFTNQLEGGGTEEQVAVLLAGSPEYFQRRSGDTNDGFLTVLYSDALHRAVDAQSRMAWDQKLASGTAPTQVAAAIFSSPEYQQDLVESLYQRVLHRSADSDGLGHIRTMLQQGMSNEQVLALLIGSAEYLSTL